MTGTDAGAMAALQVISTFDELVARQAPLAEAVAVAADLLGVRIHVQEDWNGRSQCAPAELDGSVGHPTPPPGPVPVHGAEDIAGQIVAPVAVADGRIGTVWSDPLPAPANEIVRLTVERLAAVVAIDAVRERARSGPPPDADPVAALLGLDGRSHGRDEARVLAGRCGLDIAKPYVPVAVVAREPVAGHALASALAREVRDRAAARVAATGAGRLAALILPATVTAALLPGSHGVEEWRPVAAIGTACAVEDLARGWAEARDALAFAGDLRPVVSVDELGALLLLREIPEETVMTSPDVTTVGTLASGQHGEEDLAILERYCETGSLRETAAAVHRHHSSVDYRIKKIESVLGFRLDRPTSRSRAQVAVALWHLHRRRS
jgi:hypothetical protein